MIPVSLLLKSANFNLGDIGKIFQPGNKQISKAALVPLAQNPNNLNARDNDTGAYLEALDMTASSLLFEINKSPADPALQNKLGLINLTQGNCKSAEQCFKNVVSLSRGNLSSCALEFVKFKQSGKMAEASKVVLEAAKISVELSAAHASLARVYDQQGEKQAAALELEQMSKDGLLFSTFAAPSAQLKQKDSMLSTNDAKLLAEAEALFKANQLPAALEDYRKLLLRKPKSAFVYDRIGLISVMTGDVESGIDSWQRAAKLNPSSAAIASNLGLAYHQMGMDQESEESFRKALALDPRLEEAALNLSEMLSARGELAAATAVMWESFKHNPGSARAANNLGTLLSLSGNYNDAISAFHKAIRIDSSMASAHYGMGVAFLKTHKYVPAIRELKTALALNPGLQDAQAKIEEAHRLSGIRG